MMGMIVCLWGLMIIFGYSWFWMGGCSWYILLIRFSLGWGIICAGWKSYGGMLMRKLTRKIKHRVGNLNTKKTSQLVPSSTASSQACANPASTIWYSQSTLLSSTASPHRNSPCPLSTCSPSSKSTCNYNYKRVKFNFRNILTSSKLL